MFSTTSRYYSAGTYQVMTASGDVVVVTCIPRPVPRAPIGWHRRGDEERLDLTAYQYLGDATRSWQLCEVNGSIAPDALAVHELIAIPPAGS
jgi:hypothetical protein